MAVDPEEKHPLDVSVDPLGITVEIDGQFVMAFTGPNVAREHAAQLIAAADKWERHFVGFAVPAHLDTVH